MNIATILTGSRDHDLNIKLAWTKPLSKLGHKVFIIGRTVHPDIICMYDEPYKQYSLQTQQDMEKWLGLSFKFISSLDYRGFNKRNCSDIKKEEDVNQYLTFLTIWFQDFYIKNKIQAIAIQMESFPWNLMAYYVAKKMKIPVVNIVSSRFPKKGMMFGDNGFEFISEWNNGPDPDWNTITSFYQDKGFLSFKGVGLLSYWNPQNMLNNLSKALHYVKTRRTMIMSHPYEKIALLPLWTEIDRAIWATIRGLFSRFFYKQPLKEEYFYYSLHMDLDADILEPFTSQVGLVQSISRCLPIGVKLYIKPHPAHLGVDVRLSDLYHLSKLPNVRIIHPLVSPIKLMNECISVITLNSTTGFEALILNRPLISLGHDFYCHPIFCYLVRDWGELPSVISQVYKERKPKASEEVIKIFAKYIYKNTIFTQGAIYYAEDPLTKEDGEKVAFALDKILHKI